MSKASLQRETRAKASREVFTFIAQWTPEPFENRSSVDLKERLLSFAGRDLAFRMLRAGALSAEAERCLGYVYALAETDEARGRQFMNIYDLVLHGLLLGYEREHSWMFRGQYDGRWDLLPSLYRKRPKLLRSEGDAMHDHMMRAMHSLEQGRGFEAPFALDPRVLEGWRSERLRKLKTMRKRPYFPLIESLSEYEQDAVIQHYSSGTPFLDFTTSIYVAAYFATHRSGRRHRGRRPTKGSIFVVSPNDMQREVAVGHVKAIALPKQFTRPHRQRAIFVLTGWPELVRDKSLFAPWTFWQTNIGQKFECAEYGATRDRLLPDPEKISAA